MARLSKDQWAAMRSEWEAGPAVEFVALGEKYGIHASNIGRRASAEGWQKRRTIDAIVETAQRKADTLTDSHGNASAVASENASDGENASEERKPLALATNQESEDLRAEVLARHRSEWAEMESYRIAALREMDNAKVAGDKEAWQIAKLAADTCKANMQTLETKQDNERKAWGLDVVAMPDFSNMTEQQIETYIKTGKF